MWSLLGACVDVIHAASMAAWGLGLPLLFVRRWPRLRVGYAVYALAFVVLSQLSMVALGECFLTTIARFFYEKAPAHEVSHEWFTVRLAYAVFGMAPSHRVISVVSELLVVATAVAVVASFLRHRHDANASPRRSRKAFARTQRRRLPGAA